MNTRPIAAHIEQLLPQFSRRKYPAKSTVICAGDPGDSLFYIISGTVTVLLEDDEGKEMIVAYLNKGEYFGEMGLFGDEEPRSAWIKTRTACEIAEISYEKFLVLSKNEPLLLFDITRQMVKRLKDTTQKVGDLAFLDVTGRVAHTLLDLCKQPDAMTHPDGMQIKIIR